MNKFLQPIPGVESEAFDDLPNFFDSFHDHTPIDPERTREVFARLSTGAPTSNPRCDNTLSNLSASSPEGEKTQWLDFLGWYSWLSEQDLEEVGDGSVDPSSLLQPTLIGNPHQPKFSLVGVGWVASVIDYFPLNEIG